MFLEVFRFSVRLFDVRDSLMWSKIIVKKYFSYLIRKYRIREEIFWNSCIYEF